MLFFSADFVVLIPDGCAGEGAGSLNPYSLLHTLRK